MDANAASASSVMQTLLSPEGIVFLVLSLGTLGMSIFCMTRRNPVTAVMSLVAAFFGLAAIYATLSAHFLAVLQVLVYAGAIMVLFIFVVMILNREETTTWAMRGIFIRVFALLASLVFIGWKFWRVVIPDGEAPPLAVIPDSFGTVASVGNVLFREFVFPFEAISLLLLVAIAGSVVVSRSHRKETDAQDAAVRRKTFAALQGHDYPGLPEGGDDQGDGSHGTHAAGGGGHH